MYNSLYNNCQSLGVGEGVHLNQLILFCHQLIPKASKHQNFSIQFDSYFYFSVFQLGFTTVFGAYSAFLFLRTGKNSRFLTCQLRNKKKKFFHLDKWNESVLIVSFLGHFVAPVVVHAFCNHMGFPAFQEVMSHPNTETRHKLMASFVIGLVMWMALLYPITSPFLYSNDIYDL